MSPLVSFSDLRVVFVKPRVAKDHLMLPMVHNSKDSTFGVVSELQDDINNVLNTSSFIWCTIYIVHQGRVRE